MAISMRHVLMLGGCFLAFPFGAFAQQGGAYSLLTTPSLLRFPGSPFDALRSKGIDIGGSVTSFYQGQPAGSGTKTWRHGAKGDLLVTLDSGKAGLWEGFTLNLHQEWLWGRDINSNGAGDMLPTNTAMALPRLLGKNQNLAINAAQKFLDGNLTVAFGKFNMLDLVARTPIVGGGGLETFMNVGLAAPASGVTPPNVFGVIVTAKTPFATFTGMIYDPRDALDPVVIRKPFTDGRTYSLSMTVPTQIAGLPGYYGARVAYSDKKGLDFNTIPELSLPPQARNTQTKQGYYYASLSGQQFLYAAPGKPGNGWGFFFDLGLSEGNPNALHWHVVAGIGGTGVASRDLDRWGVGYFKYALSKDLKDGLATLGLRRRDESGVEAYYNLAVMPWLRVTANLQWIRPSDPTKKNAQYAGLRTQVRF